MLIDLHVHSSGISTCCKITGEESVRRARAAGLDGMVLTNHYYRGYVSDGDFDAFARRYVAEYERAKAYADGVGFPLFFGIELTAEAYDDAHILIFGVDPGFVLSHPQLMEYDRQTLYDAVHAAGGILVHAHPLRRGGRFNDMSLLDGVELNCHLSYEGPQTDPVISFAREQGVFVTCGSDYHGDVPFRPACGVCFPEGTDSEGKIRDYLCSGSSLRVRLCSVDGRESEAVFER